MERQNNKTKGIILALILIILTLFAIIAYSFWIKPSYDEYILEKQREAYTMGFADARTAFLSGVANSINSLGYVQITFDDNQSVFLAPFNPSQVAEQPTILG